MRLTGYGFVFVVAVLRNWYEGGYFVTRLTIGFLIEQRRRTFGQQGKYCGLYISAIPV